MKSINLENNKTFKSILYLAIPSMIAQLVNVLYNIVDRIFIGNMPINGEIALVGVGVCAPILTFLSSFSYLIGFGGAPIFSMSLGENNKENAKKILSNSFVLLFIVSFILLLIIYPFAKPILYLFGASEASIPYAYNYILIYLGGTFFSILTLGLTQFIIAQGKSTIAMLVTLLGCLINVGLDPLFIYVLNMGVSGAALATLISQFISFVFVLFLLLKVTTIKLSFSKLDKKVVCKILKLGFSPFIIMCTDSIVFICLNTCIKNYGGAQSDFYIEVATIVQAFFSLATGPLLGISSGTQPLLAFNYGAKNIKLIKKSEIQLTIFALCFCTMCFGLSFVLGKPFAQLFISLSSSTGNDKIVEVAARVISIYMYGIIPLAFQYVFVDGLTGLGQAKYSIWLSLNRKLVLLLPLTILLPAITKDAFNVFYAELIADVISSTVSTIVYLIIIPKILKKRELETKSVMD